MPFRRFVLGAAAIKVADASNQRTVIGFQNTEAAAGQTATVNIDPNVAANGWNVPDDNRWITFHVVDGDEDVRSAWYALATGAMTLVVYEDFGRPRDLPPGDGGQERPRDPPIR